VLYPLFLSSMARVETRVVFPAPWTPFKPIVKGLLLEVRVERREVMNGMQCGDLSSMILGLGLEFEDTAFAEVFADIERILSPLN